MAPSNEEIAVFLGGIFPFLGKLVERRENDQRRLPLKVHTVVFIV